MRESILFQGLKDVSPLRSYAFLCVAILKPHNIPPFFPLRFRVSCLYFSFTYHIRTVRATHPAPQSAAHSRGLRFVHYVHIHNAHIMHICAL